VDYGLEADEISDDEGEGKTKSRVSQLLEQGQGGGFRRLESQSRPQERKADRWVAFRSAVIPEDEIEGVYGWTRDEERLSDETDLPYENIVSVARSDGYWPFPR
jgi:hypothetical protein